MIIEVAYAAPDVQVLVQLEVPQMATVADALAQAAAELSAYGLSQAELEVATVGIFGQVCSRETKLKEWDRVEIYRPLLMDAKEARRQRAKKQKKQKKQSRS